MLIKDIRLINFRNYNNIYISLNENINILLGKNAQGKTNLLESIYLSSYGGSFRANRDDDLINFNKSEAYVGLNYRSNKIDRLIEIKLDKNKSKRVKINRLEVKNLKELQSGLSVILFSPDDLALVKGGPSERRRFIDSSISQLKPIYRYNLSQYKKILFQRNNILKSKKNIQDKKVLLEVFDQQLVEKGSYISMARLDYIKELGNKSFEIHSNLTSGVEKLSFTYKSNIGFNYPTKDHIKSYFIENIRKNLERDLIVGTTEIGPHRDDFDIILDKKSAKTYASQGQQRTIILSMKLAEMEIVKYEKGEYPILLLDDVYSELDSNRREYLTNYLKKTQTIITSTDLLDIDQIDGEKI